MSLENQFVPFELAVKLKELGFDEECLSFYNQNGKLNQSRIDSFNWVINNSSYNVNKLGYIAAPLWQQAFDWFRNKGYFKEIRWSAVNGGNKWCDSHGVYYLFVITKEGNWDWFEQELNFKSYEESRYSCLEKLIEIISCKSEN